MDSFVTPAEIIAQRGDGIITTEEMMDSLLSWRYTFGRVACVGGVATDAYIAGDWDSICMAFYRGELTDDEFERLADYAQHQVSADPAHLRDDPPVPPDVLEREQVAKHVARLVTTGYGSDEVAAGLGITEDQITQKRLARELWAISDGSTWRFPACQFDVDPTSHRPIRQIRGLGQVLSALPVAMHPAAVDGFLHTTQPDLYRDRAQTPLEWLHDGGDIRAAVDSARASRWYGR
ncbi:hypothetical protein [Mycolicibacterium llatzerense]|uniref:hypothetical protein n=1 Tax=Mycolicibacterium llatzerense TaxID=280871 RepID=UPI0008DCC431|nr:hypothetical protein [Mycolicibacterium llatzerense]